MKKIVMRVAVAVVLLTAFSVTVYADAPPPHHYHKFTLPNGEVVTVGPKICEKPMSHEGWHKYHAQVHQGIPGDALNIESILCE